MDRKGLVFIAMGVECVVLVLTCIYLGQWLGERYALGVLGSALGAFIGLIGWVIHLLSVARTLEKDHLAKERDSRHINRK